MICWVDTMNKLKIILTKEKIMNLIPLFFYFIIFLIFAIYSYAFLDINLTLTSWEPYLRLQKRMQWFGYFNKDKSSLIFIFLLSLLYINFFLIIYAIKKRKLTLKKITYFFFFLVPVLVFSYPLFSYDIFNYIFNAKMVIFYQANPHIQKAIDFPDPMLGFMRNIHTPAPYFYGWTLLSLIPYLISFGKIFPALLSFKTYSALFFFSTFLVLKKIYSINKINNYKSRLTIFLLNPLFLIEGIVVGHNDFSMMFFCLTAFYFLLLFKKRKKIKFLLLSLISFLLSVSIKYATLVLLPLIILWFFKSSFNIGFFGAVLLFLLPFSRPMDQLHSWYFIWPLSWIFLSELTSDIIFFNLFSFAELLRYFPYIKSGMWNDIVIKERSYIFFLSLFIVILGVFLFNIKAVLKKTFKVKS